MRPHPKRGELSDLRPRVLAMTEQGAIARVTRADLPVLSMDVPLDLPQADHDPDRPLIEFYRREDEIDCLVPVRSSQ